MKLYGLPLAKLNRTDLRSESIMLMKKRSWLLIAVVAWFALGGSGMSLPSMDSVTDISIDRLWKEPRDLLVDRVEDARDAQQETIEEFKTAMEKFKAVTGFEGGELEAEYEKLNSAYERSAARAADAVLLCINAVSGLEVTAEKTWDVANQWELPVLVQVTLEWLVIVNRPVLVVPPSGGTLPPPIQPVATYWVVPASRQGEAPVRWMS